MMLADIFVRQLQLTFQNKKSSLKTTSLSALMRWFISELSIVPKVKVETTNYIYATVILARGTTLKRRTKNEPRLAVL